MWTVNSIFKESSNSENGMLQNKNVIIELRWGEGCTAVNIGVSGGLPNMTSSSGFTSNV